MRAEFGHPDVAIALTCLSYYYQGLTETQLDQCFDLLNKQDDPRLEYEKWVHSNAFIPEKLRQVSGVNVNDPEQREKDLFPLFHRNHAVVDFFLSQVVFPKEAKEFPEKLSASGWDLAETKQFTTGFSGTNDSRYLLPTSILQDDPVNQLSTNAKLLTYLLQPENNHYKPMHQDDQQLLTSGFLHLLVEQTPEIRVLLDVGAQMLELRNDELAKRWLGLKPDIPAIIFFNDEELTVMTRDGNVEAFISSPFNQQLDKCLVYLDDSHTRGTDLKLPRNFRAAVTLGPKVTKDRLLQGQKSYSFHLFEILTLRSGKAVCGCESSVMDNPSCFLHRQISTGGFLKSHLRLQAVRSMSKIFCDGRCSKLAQNLFTTFLNGFDKAWITNDVKRRGITSSQPQIHQSKSCNRRGSNQKHEL